MPSSEHEIRKTLERARELISDEPQRARQLAEGVLDAVDEFPALLGEVLGLVGNARRHCGDLEGAYTAFQGGCAVEPSWLMKGHLYCQWAFLQVHRHRYDDALRKAAQGLALVESARPSNRDVAQALVARGIVFRHAGLYAEAAQDYRRALRLAHPRKDADLHVKAVQNLSVALLYGSREAAQVRCALQTLDEAAKLLRKRRVRVKSIQYASILWARGLAFRIVGADERAEECFRRARDILLQRAAFADWIRLSLDLIESYMHYDRWGLVKKTLTEMLAHARDAEVLAALRAFHDAIQADAVHVTQDLLCAVYDTIHGGQRKVPLVNQHPTDTEPIGF